MFEFLEVDSEGMFIPYFDIFFIPRVGLQKGFNSESSMLDHLWSKVYIEPLKKDELHMVSVESITNLPLLSFNVEVLVSKALSFNFVLYCRLSKQNSQTWKRLAINLSMFFPCCRLTSI